MIILFIALFFLPVALREPKSTFLILDMFHQEFQRDRLQRQKRKRYKEYNQTRFVFCVRWGTTM